MNEKINIIKSDGSSVNADIICCLENNTGKRYVYYTLNEIVGAGANSTVKIYVSKVTQNDPTLDALITDEEWDKLKGYMSDALKGNANAEIKYVPLTGLDTINSISERAIAMPISYDYINKQRGIYAENVATAVETAQPASTPESAPAPTEPVASETPAPTEAVVEPIPIIPETPNVFDTPQQPVASVVPETPVEAPVVEPEPVPVASQSAEESSESDGNESNGSAATLTPINIDEIEKKYSEMIETINKLKEQELEAAKRYNATLELSAMHNEQHANYVQSEQNKEVAATEPVAPEVTSEPTIEPVVPQSPEAQPTPAPVEAPVSTPEPAPAAPISDANVETNWFDMPSS